MTAAAIVGNSAIPLLGMGVLEVMVLLAASFRAGLLPSHELLRMISRIPRSPEKAELEGAKIDCGLPSISPACPLAHSRLLKSPFSNPTSSSTAATETAC